MAKRKHETFAAASRRARKARVALECITDSLRTSKIVDDRPLSGEGCDSPLDQPEVPLRIVETAPELTIDADNALAVEVVRFYAARLQEETGDTPEVRLVRALALQMEAHQVVHGASLPGVARTAE